MSDGTRKHERIARDFELVWAVESRGLSGRGKLVDVSAGGVCMQISTPATFESGNAISLVCSRLPAMPTSARVLWTRKNASGGALCGLAFTQIGSGWTQWMATNLPATATARK